VIQIGQIVYGESWPDFEAHNLRGKSGELLDQAGLVTTDAYDFTGNLLNSRHQLATEYSVRPDWSRSPVLETGTFTTVTLWGQSACYEIDVGRLQRAPNGLSKITVTPTDISNPVSQFITIPATCFATADIAIDKGTGTGGNQPGSNILQGNLVFDYGLPSSGITMRLSDLDFGGQGNSLDEVTTECRDSS
jgi:hypothetical protein